MIISQNLMATNSHRVLTKNQTKMNKTLERMSTGLRIAKAADDAAGLAISEKMRAQIKGLTQAARNAQDGISLIQTADGAMNEMHGILGRMRELSVQGANDVNTSLDRQAIQKEINQLQDELVRISSDTEFNGKKLLSGDMMALTSTSDLETHVSIKGDISPEAIQELQGDYEIKIKASPVGKGQVQNSAQMRLVEDYTHTEKIVGTKIINVPTGKNLGDIIWEKTLGGGSEDAAYSIQETSDGGFIVAGTSRSNSGDVTGNHGLHDYWITKLDETGGLVWEKSLGGSAEEVATSIQETSDGGFVVAGMAQSSNGDVTGNHGNGDYWITKLDGSGALVWEKTLGGSSFDPAYSIQETSDGGFVVAGISSSSNGDVTGNHGGNDYWITKLDGSGALVWEKSLGGSGDDKAYSIQETSDGGFVVAGVSNSSNGDVTGNHGGGDYWITKLDGSGALVWEKSLGGSGDDEALSIQETSDGGFVVTGFSHSNDGDVTGNHGGNDYWITKLDGSGALVWEKSLGGSGDDKAYSIQETSDGGFVVAGVSNSSNGDVTGNHGGGDYWITKLDGSGALVWEKSLGGSGDDEALSIQETTDGNFIVAGTSASNDGDVTGNHGNGDYWITKIAGKTTTEQTVPDISYITTSLNKSDIPTEQIPLSKIDKFYDNSGNFILDPAKTIELQQGDGSVSKVTLSGADTIGTLKSKLNNSIANDLGQSKYVPETLQDKFVSYVNPSDDSGMEAMAGTFVMRSVIPGEAGEITLAGDDRVLKAIGLNTIQNAEESQFVVDITDAHTGKAVVEDYSVSKNQLLGVLNENVDVEFSSLSGTAVSYDGTSKQFVLKGGAENTTSTFITIKDNSQRLHTGANKNEEIAFTIGKLSLKSLGIDYLSVADNDSANDSLGKIDQASQKLSQERSKLGALQNRLEKSLEISENTMENITTAESRIRDTDMAKEAMLLAKQQILVQSSQAMLSQANQISSSSYEGIKQMIG